MMTRVLPACCAAALQEDNNADSVLPAKNWQREGRLKAERIFEGNYGTTWVHRRVRKEEGLWPRCKEGYWKPHEVERSSGGLCVSGLWSSWNSCTQAACVSMPVARPSAPQWCLCARVSPWPPKKELEIYWGDVLWGGPRCAWSTPGVRCLLRFPASRPET